MTKTVYDEHSKYYLDFVDQGLADESGSMHAMMSTIKRLLGDRLNGALVLDIACGEGYLGRFLARQGVGTVIGIDSSETLINVATQRSDSPKLVYRVDDAHSLSTIADTSIDIVMSQIALQDIADHRAVFQAARRVVKEDGAFAFSLLHPCFWSPCRWPEEPPFLYDDDGTPLAAIARHYGTEGLWWSRGDGARGRMGSYHRMLSTYINDLQESGFRLERLEEPLLAQPGLFSEVPGNLVIIAQPE